MDDDAAEDDDEDDEDAFEEDDVQLKKIIVFIISLPGVLFLSPTPQGGYPLRLTLCQYLHKQLVRKMTGFRPSLSLALSLSLW